MPKDKLKPYNVAALIQWKKKFLKIYRTHSIEENETNETTAETYIRSDNDLFSSF